MEFISRKKVIFPYYTYSYIYIGTVKYFMLMQSEKKFDKLLNDKKIEWNWKDCVKKIYTNPNDAMINAD